MGEDVPPGAVKTVQVHVSRLRKALGDPGVLTTSAAGYRLRVRPGELDADRFEQLAADGRRALEAGRPEDAAAHLGQALELWRGRPLAELAYAPFAQGAITALEEQRDAVLEARVEADLAAGRHAQLVGELQRLVAERPLRERLHAQLMLALYRSGRQADALAAYRKARETLVDGLGIEPGTALRDLERAILAQDPALDGTARAGAPAGRVTRPAVSVRIPAVPTPTIGRATEIGELAGWLRTGAARLVTVVGPGGVGKTRLATEAARAAAEAFRDGAVFVPLAPVAGHEHVAATIARRLEADAAGPDALARHHADAELLLVLDNYEHLLDAAPLVAQLLEAAPGLVILCTSREPLRLRAERLLELEPLALPATSDAIGDVHASPAVALFGAVASAQRPTFAVTDTNAAAVGRLCRRLDGLPLAIELVAGRLGLLSVEDLAERLGAGDAVTASGPRDAPARQRTLTATVRWSVDLLTGDERLAFAAFAPFAGGCAPAAAHAVTGAGPEVLESLVAKHLLRHRPGPDGGRLRMLETVREVARTELDARRDAEAIRRRHCEHYLAIAEAANATQERFGPPARLAPLDPEVDNLRGALRWAIDRGEAVLALRLAGALVPYFEYRDGNREAARWLRDALAIPGDVPDAVRADALDAYSHALDEMATLEQAEAAARESLRIREAIGDVAGCASAIWSLSGLCMTAHRIPEGYELAVEAHRLACASGNERIRVSALQYMASMAPTLADALRIGEEAAAASRALGGRREEAVLRGNMSYLALFHGETAAARRLAEEALAAAKDADDPVITAYSAGNAALGSLFCGDPDRARELFVLQLELVRRHRVVRLLHEALSGLAAIAATEGRDALAATLRGAADAASLERGDPVVERRLEEQCFGTARARLGEQAWGAAAEAGGRLGRDEAIDAALQAFPRAAH